jgi:serine/threonine protein kinase
VSAEEERPESTDRADISGVDSRDLTDGEADSFLRGVARAPELTIAWNPSDGEVGRRIADRFRVVRCLGAGGMGVVYEARDEERDERVAIKTLHVLDPESLYRFKTEFRSLVDVLHPNLVRLNELLCDDGKWFFTMELIEGQDFVAYLRARPDRIADGCAQVLDGLAAVHAAGKVHRDIKPSNILVTPDGRVIVLDFGLVIGSGAEGDAAGTPIYMAPEQAGGRQVGPAADLYALGAVMYEVLTGRAPFADAERSAAIMEIKQRAAVPRPSRPDLPAALTELCSALLAIDPGARPTLARARRALATEHPLDAPAVAAEGARTARSSRRTPRREPSRSCSSSAANRASARARSRASGANGREGATARSSYRAGATSRSTSRTKPSTD